MIALLLTACPWLAPVLAFLKPVGDFLAKLLSNPYVLVGLACGMLGLVSGCHIEDGKVREAKAALAREVAAHKADNDRNSASIKNLTASVAAQNAAVAAFQAKAEETTRNAQKAVSEAQNAAKAHAPVIQRIMQAPASTCDDIHKLRELQ